jgi:hypothetical protein
MGIAAAEFAEGGFSENDRPGSFKPFYHEGVALRIIVFEQHGTERGRHSLGITLIFHDHRNAV